MLRGAGIALPLGVAMFSFLRSVRSFGLQSKEEPSPSPVQEREHDRLREKGSASNLSLKKRKGYASRFEGGMHAPHLLVTVCSGRSHRVLNRALGHSQAKRPQASKSAALVVVWRCLLVITTESQFRRLYGFLFSCYRAMIIECS